VRVFTENAKLYTHQTNHYRVVLKFGLKQKTLLSSILATEALREFIEMIAEQYRNIKPHFVHADHMPMVCRWSCILLDQDTENPPFQPARYFVVNVFAETKDAVLDCLGEEYPWCDIMYVDKALGGHSDDDFLESWMHYFDAKEAIPVREAPHGTNYDK